MVIVATSVAKIHGHLAVMIETGTGELYTMVSEDAGEGTFQFSSPQQYAEGTNGMITDLPGVKLISVYERTEDSVEKLYYRIGKRRQQSLLIDWTDERFIGDGQHPRLTRTENRRVVLTYKLNGTDTSRMVVGIMDKLTNDFIRWSDQHKAPIHAMGHADIAFVDHKNFILIHETQEETHLVSGHNGLT